MWHCLREPDGHRPAESWGRFAPRRDEVPGFALRGSRRAAASVQRTPRSVESAPPGPEFASPFRSVPIVCEESAPDRSEEHTSELQSRRDLVCRLLLEKKKKTL